VIHGQGWAPSSDSPWQRPCRSPARKPRRWPRTHGAPCWPHNATSTRRARAFTAGIGYAAASSSATAQPWDWPTPGPSTHPDRSISSTCAQPSSRYPKTQPDSSGPVAATPNWPRRTAGLSGDRGAADSTIRIGPRVAPRPHDPPAVRRHLGPSARPTGPDPRLEIPDRCPQPHRSSRQPRTISSPRPFS